MKQVCVQVGGVCSCWRSGAAQPSRLWQVVGSLGNRSWLSRVARKGNFDLAQHGHHNNSAASHRLPPVAAVTR